VGGIRYIQYTYGHGSVEDVHEIGNVYTDQTVSFGPSLEFTAPSDYFPTVPCEAKMDQLERSPPR